MTPVAALSIPLSKGSILKLKDYLKTCVRLGPSLKLAKVTLVGPYPTSDFIEEVLAEAPKEIVLAVDDGRPQEYLEDIELACSESATHLTLHRVAPFAGNGLVHAKLYLFEWSSANANYRRHFLLTGSPNASLQGFGGHAETFVHLDLADIQPPEKRSALEYFAALAEGRSPAMHWLELWGASRILLPHLQIVHDPLPKGFDAWLRRGRLCHKYQPDPSFGRLILRLKKPMPQDQLGTNLGQSGFSVTGETQTFARPYVSYETGDDGATQAWRGRYFTETDYGHWTSPECFKRFQSSFVAPKVAGRAEAMSTIRDAKPELQDAWILDFLRSIESVYEAVDATTRAEYFHLTRTRSLDLDFYRQQAQTKLARDREKARDAYFAERFTSGFAFPKVPPLGDEFEEFALTLCANALAKLRGGRVTNLLANQLRKLRIANAGMTPDDLLEALRLHWSIRKPEIAGFHLKSVDADAA